MEANRLADVNQIPVLQLGRRREFFSVGQIEIVKIPKVLKVGSCPDNDKSVQFLFVSFSV